MTVFFVILPAYMCYFISKTLFFTIGKISSADIK
jgi:hypothetical protein